VSLNQHPPIVRELFDRTLAARRVWVTGDASGYIDLLSPDQLTIFGPFGGPAIEGRAPEAAARVAALFSDGVSDIDLVDAVVSDEVVCLVMVERCEANFAGVERRRRWDLRTTQIYRRSGDVWHLVHRHAEPLIDPRNLAETLDLLEKRP
jgi:ketosteroid isomerase-like protein